MTTPIPTKDMQAIEAEALETNFAEKGRQGAFVLGAKYAYELGVKHGRAEIDFQEAIDKVCKELLEDIQYKEAWIANIAMAFKDEWMHDQGYDYCPDYIHEISNKAAEYFINNLTNKAKQAAKENG